MHYHLRRGSSSARHCKSRRRYYLVRRLIGDRRMGSRGGHTINACALVFIMHALV